MSESEIAREAAVAGDRASRAPRARRAAPLARGFNALVALTLGLIVLGALVRAHEAGLACPDWPLCFGQLVPQIDLQVGFEWSHRLLAACTALLFAALAAATLRAGAASAETRRLLALAAALLLLQIVLGALTVWHRLAPWSVTAHLVTGNAFAVTLLLIACTLSARARSGAPAAAAGPSARLWISAAAALLVLQIVLGGLVSSRFAGLSCPEWPTCNAGVWFPTWKGAVGLHLLHRVNAYLLALALVGAAAASWRSPGLRGVTRSAAALGLAQVAVGVANVRLGIPVEVTGLHTGMATAIALCLALALRAAWLRPAGMVGAHGAVLHPG
ncbi:MAG TPA: COX15/CtaA family protein [Myxococcota bacterium]